MISEYEGQRATFILGLGFGWMGRSTGIFLFVVST